MKKNLILLIKQRNCFLFLIAMFICSCSNNYSLEPIMRTMVYESPDHSELVVDTAVTDNGLYLFKTNEDYFINFYGFDNQDESLFFDFRVLSEKYLCDSIEVIYKDFFYTDDGFLIIHFFLVRDDRHHLVVIDKSGSIVNDYINNYNIVKQGVKEKNNFLVLTESEEIKIVEFHKTKFTEKTNIPVSKKNINDISWGESPDEIYYNSLKSYGFIQKQDVFLYDRHEDKTKKFNINSIEKKTLGNGIELGAGIDKLLIIYNPVYGFWSLNTESKAISFHLDFHDGLERGHYSDVVNNEIFISDGPYLYKIEI